ncbi:hypothetical protein THAOC_10498, partial [Thalassiosira oceanica]
MTSRSASSLPGRRAVWVSRELNGRPRYLVSLDEKDTHDSHHPRQQKDVAKSAAGSSPGYSEQRRKLQEPIGSRFPKRHSMDELDELLNIADRIRWTDDCHRRFQELSQAQSRNVRDCDFTEADSRRLCASEHGSAGGCDLFSDNADSDDDSCLSGVVLKERYNASELLGLAKCSGFQDFATIEHTVTDGNCGYDAIRIGCSDHDLNFPESFARFREDLFILTKKLIENGVVEKSIVMPGGEPHADFKGGKELDSSPQRLAKLKSIWHEDGQYDKGTDRDSWFDGSFVSPLVAIMLKRSVVTYDFRVGRERTIINIWDSRNNRVVCFLAEVILMPPPGSICLKFDEIADTQGRPLGHYTYLRLNDD